MPQTSKRLDREARTLSAMARIYCKAHHGRRGELCGECSELLEYAQTRLACCPFGADKPTCAKCSVHCYEPAMRERVRAVMRYSGPRMILCHPLLALLHLLDGLRDRRV
ncbi:MAG: nitrous oxide-stimulated promoter family protein [Planctomycetota bacterium]|nr:nitrous oxide-stimulated promoter family protein [Planctomycetota bacterium]